MDIITTAEANQKAKFQRLNSELLQEIHYNHSSLPQSFKIFIKISGKKTDDSDELLHTVTSSSGVSCLDDSQSLTFDEMQLLQEVSNRPYNSEFYVYIDTKPLVIRMKVVMGMQIKNSEKHGNSAVD